MAINLTGLKNWNPVAQNAAAAQMRTPAALLGGLLSNPAGGQAVATTTTGAALSAGAAQSADPATAAELAAAAAALKEYQEARKQADKFVGQTFFGLMLKELRKSNLDDNPLFGGIGEETMRPELDARIAERLAESQHFGLSEAILNKYFRDRPGSPLQSAARVVERAAATVASSPGATALGGLVDVKQ